MSDLRKAAEMALEALEWNYGTDLCDIENCTAWLDKMNATIPALRQALAQPCLDNSEKFTSEVNYCNKFKQNPVAWLQTIFGPGGHVYYRLVHDSEMKDTDKSNYMPLYASPPKHDWVGLTDGERFLNDCRSAEEIEYAKAIEAKLKEKNRRTVDNQDTKCKDHPDAPHGFNRNASLTEDRYVCDCEYWEPPVAAVNMSQERVDEMAKHKHEPVAWLSLCYTEDGDPLGYTAHEQKVYGSFPVYTTTPNREWVGLTEDEFEKILERHNEATPFAVYLSIEAKLKEKNT
jgi:hypothetical protein